MALLFSFLTVHYYVDSTSVTVGNMPKTWRFFLLNGTKLITQKQHTRMKNGTRDKWGPRFSGIQLANWHGMHSQCTQCCI